MSEFDKNIMFDNISYLLKARNKKVGELESEAGVSTGYISRTREGNSKPGIDFVMNVAESLHVSIDALLKVDMSALTPTEQYLLKFLQKLIKDTVDDKLNWKVETSDMLNRMQPDMNGNVDHPLFSEETFYEEGETEYPEQVTRVVFPSHSFGAPTFITGNCYHLRMKNGVMLYLMDISKSVHKVGDASAYAKEVWITEDYDTQFLCANNDHTPIASFVDDLFTAVSENAKHPKIEKNFKSAMDAFMKNDMEDDPPDGNGGFPEELPFA